MNVDKVEMLLAAGWMREPGMAEVRRARADGRWEAAYESQKKATVPPDVLAALEEDEPARACFHALDKTSQYRLYLPVLQAGSPRARAARLARMMALLQGGEPPR